MVFSPALVFLAMASLPAGGVRQERDQSDPYELRGQVLDLFDDGKLLLSIGKDQGARKGMKGDIFRMEPVHISGKSNS